MYVSFLEHRIGLRSWSSKEALKASLASCEAGSLLLGENAERESEFYAAIIELDRSTAKFGVGICSEGIGLLPALLPRPEESVLVFGFNSEVVAVHIPDGNVAFRVDLDGVFYTFLPARRPEVFLVESELGVIALTGEGKVLWRFTRDIITRAVIHGDNLHLEFMDSPAVTLSIADGSVVE